MADYSQLTVEHLKLVQSVIARMAGNSAKVKTWTVSLVTAVVVFSGLSNDPHWLIGAGGCIPVLAFWAIDAKYLHLERCYIKLYDAVTAGKSHKAFELDYRPYVSEVGSAWKTARSWSVLTFYGALLIVMLLLIFFLAEWGT